MVSKHTPGPWHAQYDDNGFYEIGSEASSLSLVFTYGEGETDEANARLIAAAPDLLEALRVFVSCAYPVSTEINERGHRWTEAYLDQALSIARAAIAKAEEA